MLDFLIGLITGIVLGAVITKGILKMKIKNLESLVDWHRKISEIEKRHKKER